MTAEMLPLPVPVNCTRCDAPHSLSPGPLAVARAYLNGETGGN